MSKRQLGILLILLGAALVMGTLFVDLVGAGRFQGVGPVQRAALGGGAISLLIGLSLLPLGDRPA